MLEFIFGNAEKQKDFIYYLFCLGQAAWELTRCYYLIFIFSLRLFRSYRFYKLVFNIHRTIGGIIWCYNFGGKYSPLIKSQMKQLLFVSPFFSLFPTSCFLLCPPFPFPICFSPASIFPLKVKLFWLVPGLLTSALSLLPTPTPLPTLCVFQGSYYFSSRLPL